VGKPPIIIGVDENHRQGAAGKMASGGRFITPVKIQQQFSLFLAPA
jgi:hypothetical protein